MTSTELILTALLVASMLLNYWQLYSLDELRKTVDAWKRHYEDAEDRVAQVYAATHHTGSKYQGSQTPSPDHTLSVIRDITTRLEKNNQELQSETDHP